MEYYVASSYTNWDRVGEPYEKEGKLYTKIKTACPRCGGLGIIASRIENNQIVPIPVDEGICYQCKGSKILVKEARLYTQHEFETIERNKERAKVRKAEDLKAKMEAEYDHKKAVWLETNGFAEDGTSYIVKGETYSIKDQLKADGFKFDSVLMWHRSTADGYEDKVIKINVNDFFEFSAWGEGHYLTGAKDKITKLLAEEEGPSASQWVGSAGDHIKGLEVTLKRKGSFSGRYGLTNIYTFEDKEGNIYTWFTTVLLSEEVNDIFKIKGTIKGHDEYKGIPQTVLTRVKVEK